MNLSLKRAKLSRSSRQWQDEDYVVLSDGKVRRAAVERQEKAPPSGAVELRDGRSRVQRFDRSEAGSGGMTRHQRC